MVEYGFFLILQIVKSLGYFILGLIAILFKVLSREFQKALFNVALVFSWFVACSCIYPVLHNMNYPLIHFSILYVYFCIQGHRLLFGGSHD